MRKRRGPQRDGKGRAAPPRAQATAEADMNRAVNHASLMIAGGIAVAFLLTLIVLFFVFRPARFTSYLNHNLHSVRVHAAKGTRPNSRFTKPDPADTTITTGQPIIIGVHVGGKIPRRVSLNKCG